MIFMKVIVKQFSEEYYECEEEFDSLDEARKHINERIERFKQIFEIREIHPIDEPSVKCEPFPKFMEVMPTKKMKPLNPIEYSCIAENCLSDGLKKNSNMYVCNKCAFSNNKHVGNDKRREFMKEVDACLNSLDNSYKKCMIRGCNTLRLGNFGDCKQHQRHGIVNGVYTFNHDKIPS